MLSFTVGRHASSLVAGVLEASRIGGKSNAQAHQPEDQILFSEVIRTTTL